MQVALVGYGIENQSAHRYWASKGADITVCDQNDSVQLPEGVEHQLGDNYLDNLDRFDVIVRTVGMHPQAILDKNPSVGPKITTAVNLFFEECQAPIIGVTGTKGKGTTSTLITKILEAAGKKVVLAGNIGTPMLDMLEEAKSADYVVLELSSFQLYDFKYRPKVAVCLMVVPEHLNWHSDFSEYAQSKMNLFRYQNSDDVAVFNAFNQTSREIAAASPATSKLTYAVSADPNLPVLGLFTASVQGDTILNGKQPIMKTSEVLLPGRHNLENVCAAIAATWDLIGGNTEAIRSAVMNFGGLEFRLQKIREFNGATYINDSFSTTPETAIAAINAFPQPKVLILGGSDKGIPFDGLANAVVGGNVKTVLAIGVTAPKIIKLLQDRGFTNFIMDGLDNMEAIVKKARQIAREGDVVLLSTGCASFDMFTDYKDRGKQFTQTVEALQ